MLQKSKDTLTGGSHGNCGHHAATIVKCEKCGMPIEKRFKNKKMCNTCKQGLPIEGKQYSTITESWTYPESKRKKRVGPDVQINRSRYKNVR